MTSQLLMAPRESLLGPAASGLRLRLADRTGASHVVDVSEPKCTIGTAATCTVRLPEKPPGRRFDPVECFIVRGHARTVVRRLSPGVRLNGREFTDAVLHAGDRLAIGAYEIEVLPLADRGFEARDEREQSESLLAAERTAWHTHRDELCAALDRANERIAQLIAEDGAWVGRHEAAEKAIERLTAELAARAAEFGHESAEWADALEKIVRLETELSHAKQRLDELGHALDQARAERDQAQAAFDRQRAEWRSEHEAQAIELERKSSDLTAAIDQLSNLSLAFAEANAQVKRLTADFDQQSGLARQSQTALEQLREELAQARATHQEGPDGEQARRGAADEFSHEMAELRDEIEALRGMLSRERATWEDERRLHQLDHDAVEAEAKSRCAILKQRLADLTSDLDSARQRLVEEREQWQKSLADQRLESEQRLAELLTQAAAVASPAVTEQTAVPAEPQIDIHEEFTPPESGSWEEHDARAAENREVPPEAESAFSPPPERPHAAPAGDAPVRFVSPEPSLAFEAPSSAPPATTADLLSRFGLSTQHEEADSPAAAPAQHAGQGAPPHRDEEDSIDDYMTQLMARLGRGAYTPPPRVEEPRTTSVERDTPDPNPVEPAPESPAEPKLRDPSEMGRRALPPELSADLSAMREIANLNARAAIDTHARGNLLKAWLSKAAVMLLGLAAAGAETWFALDGNNAASYFIVPCAMVAVFWGWQYLAMAKRLNQAHDEVAEEAGKEGAEEVKAEE